MFNRVVRALLLISGCLSGPAAGQTNLGRILGPVRDQSGSVIGRAPVVVRNEGTGWSRDTVSQETGDYEMPNLLAGVYSVSVQQPGFKQFVQGGIVLDAGRTVRIDVNLSVGQVTEQVRVEATAPVVETETPSINNQISYDLQVKSANSTGNRPWELLTSVPTFQSGANAFVYSIGGSRGAQNEFLIDGIASPSSGSPLGSTSMSTGAAQELQVHAVNNSAEYSQPGIYEQVSRSGTNDLHGQVRYFHSNSALNARSFFAPTKASSRDHQFGIWIAGPVLLPKLYNGRDKTFFMFVYDGGRTPGFQDVNATVPTAAMRAGDFSGLATIRDPLTGQQFPDNRIPAERISAVSRSVQDRFFPLPNFGDTSRFTALNHRISFDNSGRFDHGDFRLDHRITGANTIYGRLGYQQFPVWKPAFRRSGPGRSCASCGTRSSLTRISSVRPCSTRLASVS